jgi:hypothetical protein
MIPPATQAPNPALLLLPVTGATGFTGNISADAGVIEDENNNNARHQHAIFFIIGPHASALQITGSDQCDESLSRQRLPLVNRETIYLAGR